MLTSEAVAALIGVGCGWLLGFLTQLAYGWWTQRRDARAAALFVLAELLQNYELLMRRMAGMDTGERRIAEGPRRAAWDGVGAIALRGADVEVLRGIANAYAYLSILHAETTRDAQFLQRYGQRIEDEVLPVIEEGIGAAASLAGKRREWLDERPRLVQEAE
jgi:hypothetical protein